MLALRLLAMLVEVAFKMLLLIPYLALWTAKEATTPRPPLTRTEKIILGYFAAGFVVSAVVLTVVKVTEWVGGLG